MIYTILFALGWLLAAFWYAAFFFAWEANLQWRELYREQRSLVRELEHKVLAGVEADPDGLKWYRDENRRVSVKCANICAAIRRLKGRGKNGCNPIHNF